MKLWNKTRLILQFIILAVVVVAVVRATDPEAYCPLGGLLSIGSRFINGASSCQMGETQMFLGIGLLIGILIIGKLFCSYICPIGTVTEWLGRIARKFNLQIRRLPKWLDHGLRLLKYALLFPVLYYTVNSSELFCKTFDPYFAVTTGFGVDVVFWWALAALLVTVVGSFFIQQFWCKYLCPLGALSNIFMNMLFGGGTLLIYIVLRLLGVNLPIVWLFLVWVAGGFLIEIISGKNFATPVLKIRRNESSCTDCLLCDKACPYGIEVSKMEKVNDLDCTMCADCVAACPVPDTLTIQKKNWKWLPAAATVLLVVLSLGFSSRYELSTLSERWKLEGSGQTLAKYETTIKTVKCYGSAMSLLRRIKPRKGIHGMDAYAKSHKVVVYYDPGEIDLPGIKKALFSPIKSEVWKLKKNGPMELEVAYFGVMNLNDNLDNTNLIRALRKSKSIFGMETYFGEPVRVLIYYDPAEITPEEIVKLIEVKEITFKIRDKEIKQKMSFKVEDGPRVLTRLNVLDYKSHIFKEYDQRFNKYNRYDEQQLRAYEIGIIGAENFLKRRRLPYLVSHISNEDGIVRFRTLFTDRPVALVYFDPAQIDSGKVRNLLTATKIQVTFRGGKQKEFDNPFGFRKPAKLLSVAEVKHLQEQINRRLDFLADFRK